jgi:hypothetical protein
LYDAVPIMPSCLIFADLCLHWKKLFEYKKRMEQPKSSGFEGISTPVTKDAVMAADLQSLHVPSSAVGNAFTFDCDSRDSYQLSAMGLPAGFYHDGPDNRNLTSFDFGTGWQSPSSGKLSLCTYDRI